MERRRRSLAHALRERRDAGREELAASSLGAWLDATALHANEQLVALARVHWLVGINLNSSPRIPRSLFSSLTPQTTVR